jgi:hypothetical protein
LLRLRNLNGRFLVEDLMGEKVVERSILHGPRTLGGVFMSMFYILFIASRYLPSVAAEVEDPHRESLKIFYASVPSAIQCIALALPFLWCLRVASPKSLRSDHAIAISACRQFAKCLTALIAVWIVFYFLIFVSQVKSVLGLDPWIDLFNNLQAVFLFACYWTLTAITIDGPEGNRRDGAKSVSLPLLLSFSLWFVIVFQIADVALSHNGGTPARFWLQLVSGIVVGVCMALLVGCLESEYLNHSNLPSTRVLTAFLYCYAVLQLAYLGFNLPPGAHLSPAEQFLQVFATILSLPLKILLFGFCYSAIEDGRMVFYMEGTRKLINGAPKEWDEFWST